MDSARRRGIALGTALLLASGVGLALTLGRLDEINDIGAGIMFASWLGLALGAAVVVLSLFPSGKGSD